MNIEEALDFLRNHQPMPSDKDLDKQTIDRYDEVRKLFLACKEPRCIPLLLNSFGERDCFGVYQLIEDVIRQFDEKEVIPHLIIALKSNFRSVRYWNAQIASCFQSTELLDPLSRLLDDNDFGIIYASLTALGQIRIKKVIGVIENYMRIETDPELLEHAQEIADDIAASL